MSAEGDALWFFLDAQGQQRGPASAAVLARMLDRGLLSAAALVWTQGMAQWAPAERVQPFESQLSFGRLRWWYAEAEGRAGPVSSQELLRRFEEGEVDGLTQVCSDAEGGVWRALGEDEGLRAALAKAEAERGERERAEARAREQEADQRRVFVDEEGEQRLVAVRAVAAREVLSRERRKTFVADDGVRYEWDEAEQGWVEAEDQGEEEEGGESDEEEAKEGGDEAREGGATDEAKEGAKKRKRKQRRPRKQGGGLWVYVTGLPRDVTAEEVKAHFSKVGLIALSAADQRPKIRLYLDAEGAPKGDCSVCFNAPESVQMAVDVLSGGFIRPGAQVTVVRAEFQVPDADAKPARVSKAVSHKQAKVALSATSQALSWSEADAPGEPSKFSFLKIVVLEGMFAPADFDDESFLPELEEDLASECGKCGEIDKMTVFSGNPLGVVTIKFRTSFAAQECVALMDGRFFGGRKIRCYYWDQTTDFTVKDLDKEERREEERIEEFGDWLEQQDDELPPELRLRVESDS